MIASLLLAYLLLHAPDARDVANAQDVRLERQLLDGLRVDGPDEHIRDWARFHLGYLDVLYDAEGYPR
jgi:hypothetical protein